MECGLLIFDIILGFFSATAVSTGNAFLLAISLPSFLLVAAFNFYLLSCRLK